MGCAHCSRDDGSKTAKRKARAAQRPGDNDTLSPDTFDAPLGFSSTALNAQAEATRRRRPARETATQKTRREWDAEQLKQSKALQHVPPLQPRSRASSSDDLESKGAPNELDNSASPESRDTVATPQPLDSKEPGRVTDNVIAPLPTRAPAQAEDDTTALAMLRGQKSTALGKPLPKAATQRAVTGQVKRQFFFMED
jgi:hypothetical protein